MTTPSPEAIEAAADVIWMRANSENGVCGADRQTHSYAVATEVVTDALTAAYPLMEAQAKAEALREAADAVLGPSEYLMDAATCRMIAQDLCARATDIEGKTNEH